MLAGSFLVGLGYASNVVRPAVVTEIRKEDNSLSSLSAHPTEELLRAKHNPSDPVLN